MMEYKAFFSEKFHSAKRFPFRLEVINVKGVASAMNQEHRPAAFGHVWFDATHWSVVREAAQNRTPGGPEALARLCERYWPPLYASARHRGCSLDLCAKSLSALCWSRRRSMPSACADDAGASLQVNVVTVVARAGVGKSTLVNHWLRRMAAQGYRSAEFMFRLVLLPAAH